MAHSNLYDSFPEAEEYISYGLKGIEKSHPIMSEEDTQRAIVLAEKYDLLLSGGNDFHMINKENKLELGEYGLSKSDWQLMESRF